MTETKQFSSASLHRNTLVAIVLARVYTVNLVLKRTCKVRIPFCCNTCVGDTCRLFNNCLKEHKMEVQKREAKSKPYNRQNRKTAVAERPLPTKIIQWTGIGVIDRESDKYTRWVELGQQGEAHYEQRKEDLQTSQYVQSTHQLTVPVHDANVNSSDELPLWWTY